MNVNKVYDELYGAIDQNKKISGGEAAAIVALRERMTEAEGDIDTLEGKMESAEGDIDNLQGDVSDLQDAISHIVVDNTIIKGVATTTFNPDGNSVYVDTLVEIPSGYEIDEVLFTLHRGSGNSYNNIDTVGVASATGGTIYSLAYGFTASSAHTLTFFELSAYTGQSSDNTIYVMIGADTSGNTPNLFADYTSGNDYILKTFYTLKQILT